MNTNSKSCVNADASKQNGYTGKFADIHLSIKMPNQAEPFNSGQAREQMAKTRSSFYKQHLELLDEIEKDYLGSK